MRFFYYFCSVKQKINYIISQLRGYYPEEELCELAYWIIEESTGMTRNDILFGCKGTTKNAHVQEKLLNVDIESILDKLRAHVPVQYIFGHTLWMGLDLRVTPVTLIPRPETAELVEWILRSVARDTHTRVVDIGTGSGCIAIALKQRAPLWQVTGVDISEEALAVAQENALRNHVEVSWQQADILSDEVMRRLGDEAKGERRWDIIVSNPPYICEKEKKDMEARVLDYEPHSALFVPDTDPLLFYRKIATLSAKSEGELYLFFEINEAYGSEVCAMLREMGYTDVELKHDMYGKARMVRGRIAH